MRKSLRVLIAAAILTMLFSAIPATGMLWAAQEGQHATTQAEGAHGAEGVGGDSLLAWKIANFVIFAGIIAYFIMKYAPGFFASRTAGIRKSIEEGARRSQEAEARASEIEQKIAGLQAEIEAMRAAAHEELAKEGMRIEAETRHSLSKIQDQAVQQIALSGKAAQQDLKEYAADLAITLARRKIAAPLPADTDRSLVLTFLADLPKDSGTQRRPA